MCLKLFFCAGAAMCVGLAFAVGEIPLIDDDEPLFGWSFGRGEEFPGAKGALDEASGVEAQRRPALRLAADFTGGGNYVQMGRRIDPVDLESLSMWVKGPIGADSFTLRLIDGTGQCHQLPIRIAPSGAWQRIVFPVLRYFDRVGTSDALEFVGRYEKWGGANDSKWHQPLKGFYVIAGRHVLDESKKGEFLFSGITLSSAAAANHAAKAHAETFGGRGHLDLALSELEMLAGKKVDWTGACFPASPGPWRVSATASSALHSPDNSFCVRFYVECLGPDEKVIGSLPILEQCGKKAWRRTLREVEFPRGTSAARFVVRYQKTHGSVVFKDVSAVPVSHAIAEKIVDRILIDGRKTVDGRKKTNGHLFLPEETVDFEIAVQTLKPLPQKSRKARVTVCDYWGAELVEPREVVLSRRVDAGGAICYATRYEVPSRAVEVGKYCEIRVRVAVEGFVEANEHSGFARLPLPESKKYPAKDIPFQIRNWDSRIREYFELADRIGHRNIGLWGDSGWDFVESLGDNWYTGGFAVEVERDGWKNTSPEQVYKKTFDLVSRHKDDKFWFICQGNEPNERPERAKEKVEAYEQVYKAAHAAKPDITVVATSVPALDCFFKEGFGKWCDVYDFHVYETYENVRQGVRRYKEMGRKYGCEKPVWCTELGLNSQGQTRYAVACELVKKITAFFAEGGASVSWFTIQYPDGDGKARGTGGDCHNTFDCQYCLYNPRLDAIMYSAMINGVTVKKVVDEVQHDDGVQAYLFRDKAGDSLLVLWKEGDRVDRGVSLPGAHDIELTRIDGSHQRLAPKDGVVTLGLSGEPVLLRYSGGAAKLMRTHAPAALSVDSGQDVSVLKGAKRKVVVKGPSLHAADLRAMLPPRWKASFAQKGANVEMTVEVPKETDARAGRVMVQRLSGDVPCGEIALTMNVMSPIGVVVRAAARKASGEPGVAVSLANNAAEAKEVSWTVELVDAWKIAGGTFHLNEKGALGAYLTGQNEGRAKIAPGASVALDARIADFEPQTIYLVRTTVFDDCGRKATSERYVGGFAKAVRAKGGVRIDGLGDEPFWRDAPAEIIGSSGAESLRYGKDSSPWRGPDDLSCTWKAAWDDKCLYLLVDVNDDVYRATIAGANLWNQDGLQFLFDPMRDSAEKSGKYDYGCAVTPAGPEAFCYLTAHPDVSEGRAPFRLAEKRLGGGSRRYEVAIPWKCLRPFRPESGADLGMSMILNEDDGDGRIGFSGWFSGPHSKDLDHVGDLVLE